MLTRVDVEILRIIAGLADQSSTKTRSQDLDFVDLFQAFEAFTEENELTPERYHNYFTCLSIIVNLCNFPGSSWFDRMNSYLQTYSASELRKANNQILREKLRGFDSNTKERFLSLWYESYVVLHDKDTRQSQLAVKTDYVNSVRNPFRIWRQRCQYLRSREAQVKSARQMLLKRRMFGNMIINYRSVLKNQMTADTVLRRHYFEKWNDCYGQQMELDAKANLIYERNVKQNALETWDQAKTEQGVTTVYNERLASEWLDHWISRTKTIVDAKDVAVSGDREELISNALVQWMDRLAIVEDMNLQASEFANRLALKNAFECWKRRTVYDDIYYNYESYFTTKLKKHVFAAWRMRSLQIKEARRFRDFMCCYNQFHAWRIACRSRQMEALKNEELAAKHLKIWSLEEKLVFFSKIKNTQLAVEVLNHWRLRREELDSRTRDQFKQFQAQRNARLAKDFLQIWRSHFNEIKVQANRADQIYNTNISKQAFYALVISDDKIIQNEETAVDIWTKQQKTRYLATWTKSLANLKKKRREDIFDKYLADSKSRILRQYLSTWVNNYLDVEELNQAAESMVAERDESIQRDYLGRWTDKYTVIARNYRLADSRFDQTVLENAVDKWKTAKYELDDLHSQSSTFLANSDFQRLERIYRIWRMRMFKLKTKARDADDFNKRLLDLRFRTLWRYWKLKTQDVQAETSFLHQKNIRASTRKSVAASAMFHKKVQMSLPAKIIPAVTFPELNDGDGGHFPPDFVLETPTRSRIRKPLPVTSLGRWRRTKTPGPLSFDSQLTHQTSVSPSDGR